MRPNLLKEKETEKEVSSKPVNEETQSEFDSLPEPQEIHAQKEVVEVQKDDSKKPNLFSSATFTLQKEEPKLESVKPNILFESKNQTAPVEEIQEQEVELDENKTEQTESRKEHEFFEIKGKAKKKPKPQSFRFKLLTIVYCVIIAVTSGWVITNAVRISNVQSTIESTQNSIEINGLKFKNKIESLDKLKDESESNENSSLVPIEEIITIQPRPLENPTDYAVQSNWFDKICNWFGHLFGG